MRRLLAIGLVALAATALAVLATGASGDGGGDYRVRAIFDSAFTVIEGEDVRVAGVNVGVVSALEVTEDNRAAVVLDITDPAFQDFRRDATCTIRPQSLIGERFVECTPTQPRADPAEAPPELEVIPEGEPGAGQRLLPVEQTSKAVDTDLINNVMRLPQRQRLAIILNELGAGVAGRGEDLNETIRRANPALGATNRVLAILAEQNEVLEQLAVDSDRVLEPLSRDRDRVASFIVAANDVSRATAERREALEANFERLPRFLEELRPTMERLEGFADEFQPVLRDLQAAAPDINRLFEELGPFSEAAIPAVETLGDALTVGRPALVRSKPIVDDLRDLFDEAEPLAANLSDFATSLRDSGGIERLMDYLFFQVAAVNGFDSLGHYLRAGLIVNTCSTYTATPQPGCSARFRGGEDDEDDEARAADADNVRRTFAAKSGAERGEAGGERAPRALKLPAQVLPGDAPARPPAREAPAEDAAPGEDAATAAEQGVLDYLLGDGS